MSSNRSNPVEFRKEDIFRVRELIKDHGADGWDKAWQEGVTPWDGRDRQQSDTGFQPPLREVIETGEVPLANAGRALVPGCGRGYDVVYFSRLGLEAWGIDLSPKAIALAQKWAASLSDPPTNVQFKVEDFFQFDIPTGRFDVMYDYTFFVALPPSLREAWGARVRDLIKPGGYLIALVYPIDGPRTDGPPYSVSVATYEAVLGDDAWTKIVDRESEKSAEGHKDGRERIAVFQRIAETSASSHI